MAKCSKLKFFHRFALRHTQSSNEKFSLVYPVYLNLLKDHFWWLDLSVSSACRVLTVNTLNIFFSKYLTIKFMFVIVIYDCKEIVFILHSYKQSSLYCYFIRLVHLLFFHQTIFLHAFLKFSSRS